MTVEQFLQDHGAFALTVILSAAASFVVFRGIFWRIILIDKPWDIRDAQAILALNAMISFVLGVFVSTIAYVQHEKGLLFAAQATFFVSAIVPVLYLICTLTGRASRISVQAMDRIFATKLGSLTEGNNNNNNNNNNKQ